ncbi:MAG: hypothetical protein CVV06_15270 [Gammaproteobacteria bacterium HGW-Gammaproteobacteria-10]|nr:MAG: hypothetical protein CVV06_15270 [Gammaproteobacteria bacterium HGW-Gammaproteobacteria-10]
MLEEAPECPTKALPAWSWQRANRDVFTASFDGQPRCRSLIYEGYTCATAAISKTAVKAAST